MTLGFSRADETALTKDCTYDLEWNGYTITSTQMIPLTLTFGIDVANTLTKPVHMPTIGWMIRDHNTANTMRVHKSFVSPSPRP